MLKETWNTFPRQMVQKINGLLDQAQPNSLKAFHIYKMCKNENLWDKSYSEFSYLLSNFYQTHPAERSKSQMDQFLNQPMDWRSFESVKLTFRTADIGSSEIRDIASWAHHMLRLHYDKAPQFTSIDTLSKAIFDLTHPEFNEKDQDIDFEDFCDAWKSAADKLYGKKFEAEHELVLSELRNLNHLIETHALEIARRHLLNRIYLTQTEINWVEKSREAVMAGTAMPRYPLSRGPDKSQLVDLLKWLTLWEVSRSSKAAAVQDKVEKLRIYIQNECDFLLATCRR
ncbi:hypothetical protein CIK05_05575 [Bdellovibrio sp. qaytius]|nr:hypothetical protein CIK05_05575 [Bdellovibrio sp. qaytius]